MWIHVYQNTVGGFLLFYSVTDFLVFFSIVCTVARRYRLRLAAVIPMFDHIHLLVECESERELSTFVHEYSRAYAHQLNTSLGSAGQVFNHSYGCSVKNGDKAIRTSCSYAYNNPGEKGLCKRAQDYRWTFLAYAQSDCPFSEKIVLSRSSAPLRRALKLVDYWYSTGQSLRHACLESLFQALSRSECEQLTDYIIASYNVVDYPRLISFYGNYPQMCLSFASNQGSEYDIQESFIPGSHKVYLEIASFLKEVCGFTHVKDALRLHERERRKLSGTVILGTRIPKKYVFKYLRLVEDK